MQSFGFTGYQMDEAGGLYFAQARRYDAGAGRFTSEDVIKGHIAVPYTMNHYNYCWNRPMDLVDLNGMTPTAPVARVTALFQDMFKNDNMSKKVEETNSTEGTLSIKLSGNLTVLLGVYVDIGISVDRKGNAALQWSYSVPGVNDTVSGGVFDAGATVSIAGTDAETVDDLLGPSSSIGASGGYLGYLGFDAISFEDMSDMSGDVDGFQISAGIGAGIDVHMTESYTQEIYKWKLWDSGECINE